MTAKKAATSAKHAATKKHKASAKHTETKAQLAHLHVLHVEHTEHVAHMAAIGKPVTVKAKQPAHAKATKAVAFGIGDHLPVCSFEAVAMSLRLAGQRVHDDDVAELWHLLGEPADGVPVGEALAAAALFGLAGCRLRSAAAVFPGDYVGESVTNVAADTDARGAGACLVPAVDRLKRDAVALGQLLGAQENVVIGRHTSSVVLHVDRPGPHAVLATADGWWSWGELYSPWPCHVSEAWAVSWS